MISNYLLSFNSEKGYASSEFLIKYLDEKYPEWRSIITDPNEFIEFFKTDVHVFKNSYLKTLADEVFDIISNKEMIVSVWNDSAINEWYRYAAIRRLISIDSDTYLPIYYTELISGGFVLGGYGFTMISELYDFPNSLDIVLKSYPNCLKGNNFEYLAQNACAHMEKYTVEIRKKILKERNCFIRKNCDITSWHKLTIQEKLYLTTVIVANEYAKFHDVITFENFLMDRDDSKTVFITRDFSHYVHELQQNPNSSYRHEIIKFDCPRYNMETHQYTPSEQFSRFLSFAETDPCDEEPYELLKETMQRLSYSSI